MKDGLDLFVAPMLFHVYKFQGKLSKVELQLYENAEANKALIDDQDSGEELSDTEEDEVYVAPIKVERETSNMRVLRGRSEAS